MNNSIDRELAGFIYADGCCMIIKQSRKKKYKDKVYSFINYVPRINITQRADNLKFLEFVKERYGGHISPNNSLKNSNPVFYWQVQSFERCLGITEILLDTKIPYSKLEAVRILNEFCKWRIEIGKGKFKPEELKMIEDWHRRIRLANSYKE